MKKPSIYDLIKTAIAKAEKELKEFRKTHDFLAPGASHDLPPYTISARVKELKALRNQARRLGIK